LYPEMERAGIADFSDVETIWFCYDTSGEATLHDHPKRHRDRVRRFDHIDWFCHN
jgi:hypothetical protein